jgi:hypothetical protein
MNFGKSSGLLLPDSSPPPSSIPTNVQSLLWLVTFLCNTYMGAAFWSLLLNVSSCIYYFNFIVETEVVWRNEVFFYALFLSPVLSAFPRLQVFLFAWSPVLCAAASLGFASYFAAVTCILASSHFKLVIHSCPRHAFFAVFVRTINA